MSGWWGVAVYAFDAAGSPITLFHTLRADTPAAAAERVAEQTERDVSSFSRFLVFPGDHAETFTVVPTQRYRAVPTR